PNLLFVDAGDLLFETIARPPAQMLTQKQLKARTLAQGDVLLGAVARAVGQRDLALGAPFVAATAGGIPLLDAAVAPVPGAREQELKGLDARIQRFRLQLAAAPQRREQLQAKIRELEERKRAILAAPLPQPAPGSSWAQATFVPLTKDLGVDADAQKLVDAYDQKVTELNL